MEVFKLIFNQTAFFMDHCNNTKRQRGSNEESRADQNHRKSWDWERRIRTSNRQKKQCLQKSIKNHLSSFIQVWILQATIMTCLTRYANWYNSVMNIMGVTSNFFIGFKAYSKSCNPYLTLSIKSNKKW